MTTPSLNYLDSPPAFWWGTCFAHRFSFLCCVFVLPVLVLCLVYPMLPVSLDCPFLIAPSVFSNIVYPMLPVSLDFPFLIAPSVFSNIVYPMLPVSLDCPFLIAPSVFSTLSPVSYVPNVASVSGLSILDCPYGFL